MSYGVAKRMSKHGDQFGTGRIEGVIAPETAAHAAGTAALLPMLSLGVPGSPTAAVLLGGLLIWGLQPGPLLFQTHADLVWTLIASLFNEGKAAMVFNGPWFIGEISPSVDFGLAVLPVLDEAGKKPMRPWLTIEELRAIAVR